MNGRVVQHGSLVLRTLGPYVRVLALRLGLTTLVRLRRHKCASNSTDRRALHFVHDCDRAYDHTIGEILDVFSNRVRKVECKFAGAYGVWCYLNEFQ